MSALCKDCGLEYDYTHHMVMLHNDLWSKVSKGHTEICLCSDCIEKRLGRKLTMEDLKPNVTVNYIWIKQNLRKAATINFTKGHSGVKMCFS